jgi:hypothetical protein
MAGSENAPHQMLRPFVEKGSRKDSSMTISERLRFKEQSNISTGVLFCQQVLSIFKAGLQLTVFSYQLEGGGTTDPSSALVDSG